MQSVQQTRTMTRSRPSAHRQEAPRLVCVVTKDDDWTGLSNAAERRKRQNRLNVRAYRKRKARATTSSTNSGTPEDEVPPFWNDHTQPLHALSTNTYFLDNAFVKMDMPAAQNISTTTFPLSSDHLITIVQFNVLRGSLTNRGFLNSINPLFSDPTDLHIFSLPFPSQLSKLPSTLHPTPLQCTMPHPHCIDIIPHPGVRDNMIRALSLYDAGKLWMDTAGGFLEGITNRDISDALVWDRPWHWDGWELSERFVKSWGWLLIGCEEVLWATNKWREARGEEPLVLDLGEVSGDFYGST